jgi:hypothetical protein
MGRPFLKIFLGFWLVMFINCSIVFLTLFISGSERKRPLRI